MSKHMVRLPLRPALSLAALAAIAGSVLLVGCRDRLDDVTAVQLNNPEKRHPIHFTQRRETLHVEVAGSTDGLSPDQEADVHRFLERYRAEAQGPITVSAPSSGRGRRAADQVRRMLTDADVPRRAVRLSQHGNDREFSAAVQLSYQRPQALPPQCGDWSEDVGVNRERVPYPQFGCATQQNLATMVANSRDLIQPQDEDPRSSERRSVSWGAFASPPGGGGATSSSTAAPGGGSDGAKGKPAAIK
jgi:pilus assembly protein CpaD